MKAMAIGDLGFFYHSVNEKRIVGIVEVSALYHPDDTDPTGRFGMVDVKAVTSVNTPVTLADIKANPKLADIALIASHGCLCCRFRPSTGPRSCRWLRQRSRNYCCLP